MQYRLTLFPFSILALMFSVSAEIHVGDSMDTVRRELGNPRGRMEQQERTIWLYPEGSVDFHDGNVFSISMRTSENLAKREADRAERKRLDEERRAASVQKGEAKISELVSSPRFTSMTPADRIKALDAIVRAHPGTALPKEYHDARQAARQAEEAKSEDLEMQAKAKRLQELKQQEAELSSAKRRRFLRSHRGEIKALEAEVEQP